MKLTDVDSRFPVCSPDGKWVYFENYTASQVWRVLTDGSAKAELVPGTVLPQTFLTNSRPALSPDGKVLAVMLGTRLSENMKPENKIALINLDSASPARVVPADLRIGFFGLFTADGKALAYAIRENGIDNVWVQPLDGSPGKKITNFDSEQIDDMQWSPDGKTLGLLRFHSDSDVVLLQETKP